MVNPERSPGSTAGVHLAGRDRRALQSGPGERPPPLTSTRLTRRPLTGAARRRAGQTAPVVLVAVVVVVAIAFVVAAVIVGGEARRLGRQRFRPVYRLDEAVDHVADDLPYDVAAVLTHDEVRRLLRWHLNVLQFEGDAVLAGLDDEDGTERVTSDGDTTGAVYRQARGQALEVTRPQVEAVVASHLGYLRAIGAVEEIGHEEGG